MMDRRGFFKLVGKAAAAVPMIATAKIVPAVEAPFKASERIVGGTITSSEPFAKALWPGIEKHFKETYDDDGKTWYTMAWADERGKFK